jgi:hypothetical protein
MGGLIDVRDGEPKLQRVEPHRFGSTLGIMALAMVRICSCRSTAALRCVMMAAIWRYAVSGAVLADLADVDW